MADKTLIYRDQILQHEPEIPGQRGYSISYDWLEDAMEESLRHLGTFLRITSAGEGDTADVADIAGELLSGAKEALRQKFGLIEEHFGSIRIGHFTHGQECKDADVEGRFVGIQVMRKHGDKWQPVAMVEQGASHE